MWRLPWLVPASLMLPIIAGGLLFAAFRIEDVEGANPEGWWFLVMVMVGAPLACFGFCVTMTLPTSQVGRWSVASGGVSALLVLSLVTMLAFSVTHYLRYSVGWTGANIYGHWILLYCSLATGVPAIAAGIRAIWVPDGNNRRFGSVGLTLGVLSLGCLAAWEWSGWYFSLFWDI